MIPVYVLADTKPFQVDYLVVAGGGRGQGNIYPSGGAGGGGGAGGYISGVPGEQSGGPSTVLDSIVFIGGQSVSIAVGAGGSAKGGDSSFGSITAEGGGYGENSNLPSQDGGSGGGAPFYSGQLPGSGTTNQGNDGGTGSSGANFPADGRSGGGGGAAEDGNTDGTSQGGDGLASSITGTSTYYAGGGGGALANASSAVAGGLGGGGNGRAGDLRSPALDPATPGGTNTGGGGGGGGANGGSGIVILRYPAGARIIDYVDPGLSYTYSDDGIWKRYIFTSGSGSIRF